MDSIRALLVEDDASAASSLQAKLASTRTRGASFAVERHRTLRSAVSRVRAGDIDVVLLDLDLPDSSGVDSVVRMHAAAPEVPIVVVTAANDDALALRSLRARAEDYIVKGRANRAMLQRTICHALERRRSRVSVAQVLPAQRTSEDNFRNIVESSRDGVVVISRTGAVLFANPAAVRLVGRRPGEINANLLGYLFTTTARRELELAAKHFVEVHVVEGEWDGDSVWITSLFDITRHKRSHADLGMLNARMSELNVCLEKLASIDPLTELLNRRGLANELDIEVHRRQRTGSPLAAVLLDCDDFKHVNDTIGQSGGDVVLKGLADRLKESLRPSDHIGRIGGDEFLMLLPDTRFGEAFQVAERLRLSVSAQPLRSSSGPIHIAASLGIELVPDEIVSIDDVLEHTQRALQESKRNGKNRVSTRDVSMSFGAAQSDDVVRALRDEAAYRIVRVPIVRLCDEVVVGWEMIALGPKGIFEMPRDFSRLALERDILTEVDLHCVRACVRRALESPTASSWHIHVYPSTLLETSIENLLALFCGQTGSTRFCVELSEQHFVGEPALLRDRVRALKQAGIRVAIDDVGFGRSSLEALILLDPDLVKIDPKFVHRTSREVGQVGALQRMAGVVASLNSELVARGIESRQDLQLLVELGVPYGQGTLWGLPA